MNNTRQKVFRLSQYPLLSSFKFSDLVYLSQNYEERSYLYKQYLYREGDEPSHIYLVESGLFHYTKEREDQDCVKFRQIALKKKKHKITPNFETPYEESVYTVKRQGKVKEYQVGSFSAHQILGEEEIINNKPRRLYNAKCLSTSNKVLIFARQHIEKILEENQELAQEAKQHASQKSQISKKLYLGIKQTENNLESFLEILKKEKQSDPKNFESSFSQMSEDRQTRLPLIDSHKRNADILKKKNHSIGSISHTQMSSSKQSVSALRSNGNERISSQSTEHNSESETFALTEAFGPKFKEFKQSKDMTVFEENQQPQNDVKLKQYDDSIPLKETKSWNKKLNASEQQQPKAKYKQKYFGMIDSSTLIKEKEFILSIQKAKDLKDPRQEFEDLHRSNYKQIQLLKERGKVSNAAHSKQYMEKILLDALRRAGYQESIPVKTTEPGHSLSKSKDLKESILSPREILKKSDIFSSPSGGDLRGLKKQGSLMKKKRLRPHILHKSGILEDSEFDQCYFQKI